MIRYLIIGNGVAGTTAAENIRKQDKDGDITIITEEDLPFYSRIRLNEYIAGDITEQDLQIKKEQWYRDQAISLNLNTRVSEIRPDKRVVITSDKEKLVYDALLIATGSSSFIPPIKGADKQGVFALRNMQDGRDIISFAAKIQKVILIGGGLLGLEAGNALRRLGKHVTVIEFFPRLLPRQLDKEGAARLKAIMEDMGFSFRLDAVTEEITAEDHTGGVVLKGGDFLEGEMVIISAGVRPNKALALSGDIKCDKGIIVDGHMRTETPGVYAAGDVTESDGRLYGIWPAAMDQGKIAGINMSGGSIEYGGTAMANTLKVAGIDLASAGEIDADDKFESMISSDEKIYRKAVFDGGRVIGCIMLGNTKGFNQVTKIMNEEPDADGTRDRISEIL
ncbi:MAG: NAD(P)/FAD-dependent oxidoreductase [Deltaproteobacteria bacterium]|nr:NAD(P)/FAD-dependent oxidoreductase [Deltaproteobacteria bacterium]